MKVLTTGALGQLGCAVMQELAIRGHEGIGTVAHETDLSSPSTPLSQMNLLAMDVCDSKAVLSLVEEIGPDAIIHCAAWTDVDAAEELANKEIVWRTNVIGTRNLVQAAKACRAKMLYVSSDYVFSGKGEEPWKPEDAREPLNYYGQTKYEGEQVVAECLESYFIVRTSWLFSSYGKNFVDTIIKAGENRDEVRVVNDQVGTPTYAPDLARLLVDMVQTSKYGIYHVTNAEAEPDGYISWYDFAQEVFSQRGVVAKLVPVSSMEYGLAKAARPSNSRLDKAKLLEAGFVLLPDWKDALRRCLESVQGKTVTKSIRVLWITTGCSLHDVDDNPSLSGRYESAMVEYAGEHIKLAVAHMADGLRKNELHNDDISYYAVKADLGFTSTPDDWEKARSELLGIIDEFKPDVIQCFGAEWPYGAIAEAVDTPVIIHMMGFLNAYYPAIRMAQGIATPDVSLTEGLKSNVRRALLKLRGKPSSTEERICVRERRIMAANRFFMGRTAWDHGIVEHYAPGAKYYHVPEIVKPKIYESAGQWRYHYQDKLRILSFSRADDRKGVDVILRTAQILKDLLHLDFEWRITADGSSLAQFEQRCGISYSSVNVHPIGDITCSRIVEELVAADFFVHPSIIDNSPHAVCEAQLVGCPVLASNVGGVPSLVEHGVTGFLYPYNEPLALAFLISDNRFSEGFLTKMSRRAVQTALERHDPKAIARILLQVYRDVAGEGQA